MKPLQIISDLHIGVKRSAGTTPASALALRHHLLASFKAMLPEDRDLLILGDLFDEFTVDGTDFLETFTILSNWLETTDNRLYLVRGNHDWSPKASAKSSFDILADILSHVYFEEVTVITDGLTDIGNGILVIPHMPNQDCFDLELDKAAQRDGLYLLTHCNMMPPACYGKHDHSLTIDEDRAKHLAEKFVLINAHEHQHISYNVGKGIHCLGNQVPSSVADCLSKGRHQADGLKYSTVITADMGMERIVVWEAIGSFSLVDWRDLDQVPEAQFLRVSGNAKAEEAALVVDAIAKLRRDSSAFVITNAVQVEGQEGIEEAAAATFESMKVFDVMAALLDELEPEERKVIEGVTA